MSPWFSRFLPVGADLLVLLAAGAASLALHWDGRPPPGSWALYAWQISAGAALFVLLFAVLGVYRRLWQYAGVRDLLALLAAAAAAGGALAFAGLPAGLWALYWLLATGGVVALRAGARAWRDLTGRGPAAGGRRVLIAGAGEAGAELARELVRHPELGLLPVGFVDDSAAKRGQQAYSLRVAGTCRELGAVARRLAAQEVIVAMPSAPGQAIRALLDEAVAHRLPVRLLPPLAARAAHGLAGQVREVRLEDLIGRPEVHLDLDAAGSFLSGRTVLVTGAGGSIGSELCRQVARAGPAALVLLGHGENSLFQIDLELRARFPGLVLYPVVADIQDEWRICRILEQYRPAVVFHAAAHKHVPLMELNPQEAVRNNVLGTYHVAWAAHRFGAERFVLVSTDKAVNPSSVMGATKQVAERVVRSLAAGSGTGFVTVRFGNVLGSRGSVVPLFREQIARGGPVTVTHPDATRYFMTIPEAASLIIQAAAIGSSGELFLLDMGEPVRILDLARDLIRLAGLEPDVSIPIAFTGIRPGEKLAEELLTPQEGVVATRHERILRVRGGGPGLADLPGAMEQFRTLARAPAVARDQILALLDQTGRGGARTDGHGAEADQPH